MYDIKFEAALAFVLRHEGGLVDDPADPGGLTNLGIALRDHPELTADDIRDLTPNSVAPIYYREYWTPHNFWWLPGEIAAKAFDAGVNMGPKFAIELLQRAANVCGHHLIIDGSIGNETASAAEATDPAALRQAYTAEIVAHYRAVAAASPTLARFLSGWLARAEDWDIAGVGAQGAGT